MPRPSNTGLSCERSAADCATTVRSSAPTRCSAAASHSLFYHASSSRWTRSCASGIDPTSGLAPARGSGCEAYDRWEKRARCTINVHTEAPPLATAKTMAKTTWAMMIMPWQSKSAARPPSAQRRHAPDMTPMRRTEHAISRKRAKLIVDLGQ